MEKLLVVFVVMVVLLGLSVQSVESQERRSVCLDPGHGGSDPGAVGVGGVQEKNINLDVAIRLLHLLENAGWRVYITRSNDSTVSLSSRTSYANNMGVQLFVSIHCNAYNGQAHGTETFCYEQGSSTSFRMRDNINPEVVNALHTYNRGVKTAGFYVLKYTNMPAVLTELAFIDNAGDAAKLKDPNYRQRAAEAIKRGLDATRNADSAPSTLLNEYIAPRWSPDGTQILATNPDYRGIYIFPATGGDIKTLCAQMKAGYRARWISNDQIEYTLPLQRESEIISPDGLSYPTIWTGTDPLQRETFIITTNGTRYRSDLRQNEISVEVRDGEIWATDSTGQYKLSRDGDIFYNPSLSPNNKLVVFEGLNTGMYVCDIFGTLYLALGNGNHPCWTPDSQKIIFDRSQEDGSQLTASDIWMVDIEQMNSPVNLTGYFDHIAQHPSVSPDGIHIAFDADGKIFVGELNGGRNFCEIKINR